MPFYIPAIGPPRVFNLHFADGRSTAGENRSGGPPRHRRRRFGAGINWGLPSKSVDSYFFSADSKVRTDSRQAYLLSRAGISRLAPNDQKLDRSKPITLIDNQTPMDPADAAGRGASSVTSGSTLFSPRASPLTPWSAFTPTKANSIPESTVSAASGITRCGG